MRFQKVKYLCLSQLRKFKDSVFPFKAFEKKKKNEITYYNTFKKQQSSKNELKLDRCQFMFTDTNYSCNSSIYTYKLLHTTTVFLERNVSHLE